jgi:hypothetical protein
MCNSSIRRSAIRSAPCARRPTIAWWSPPMPAPNPWVCLAARSLNNSLGNLRCCFRLFGDHIVVALSPSRFDFTLPRFIVCIYLNLLSFLCVSASLSICIPASLLSVFCFLLCPSRRVGLDLGRTARHPRRAAPGRLRGRRHHTRLGLHSHAVERLSAGIICACTRVSTHAEIL